MKAQVFIEHRERKGKAERRIYYLKQKAPVIVGAHDSPTKNAETKLTEEFLEVLPPQ